MCCAIGSWAGFGEIGAWKPRNRWRSRHVIHSRKSHLAAVFVTPKADAVKASVLICHGIGETVDHWLGVQQLLAASGVASLVFDYSGFGRSSGFFHAERCVHDAVTAFTFLKRLTGPLPVSVLGFSLGSGIAAAMISRCRSIVWCSARHSHLCERPQSASGYLSFLSLQCRIFGTQERSALVLFRCSWFMVKKIVCSRWKWRKN